MCHKCDSLFHAVVNDGCWPPLSCFTTHCSTAAQFRVNQKRQQDCPPEMPCWSVPLHPSPQTNGVSLADHTFAFFTCTVEISFSFFSCAGRLCRKVLTVVVYECHQIPRMDFGRFVFSHTDGLLKRDLRITGPSISETSLSGVTLRSLHLPPLKSATTRPLSLREGRKVAFSCCPLAEAMVQRAALEMSLNI